MLLLETLTGLPFIDFLEELLGGLLLRLSRGGDTTGLSLTLLRDRAPTGLLLILLPFLALAGLPLTLLSGLLLLSLLTGLLLILLDLAGEGVRLLLLRLLLPFRFGLPLGLLLSLLGLILILLLLLGLMLRLLDLPGWSSTTSGCLSSLLSDLASAPMPLLLCSPFSLGDIPSPSLLLRRTGASSFATTEGGCSAAVFSERSLRLSSFPGTSRPSSSEILSLSLPLSVSVILSDALLALRLDLLSRFFRLLSRRFSLLLPRLYLSLLEDLFLFLRLSSLEELVYDDDDESNSESLSDSDDSNSVSEEVSDSDE